MSRTIDREGVCAIRSVVRWASIKFRAISWCLLATLLMPATGFAQFSASIQGTVEDPSGARVAGAEIKLLSADTNFSEAIRSDDSGSFRFLTLAPGAYQVTATAAGFSKYEVKLTLTTGQNLNVPISFSVSSTTNTVEVTGQLPVLDTAETRNQQTIEAAELTTLPLLNQNMTSLVTLAPGVKGLGLNALGGSANTDNYNWAVGVDANANGQSANANMWVIDGLDVTDNIRPGQVDLLPNPETIQEATTAVNTYNVEYGRGSSVVFSMTTKSGSNQFHGAASDYFNYQNFWAGTEFVQKYSPFHGNNGTGSVGGPILAKHQLYFFFSYGLLRSVSSFSGGTTWEDPAFVNWAQATFPNTVGTKIVGSYLSTNGATVGVAETALQDFGAGNCDGSTAATSIPCSTPVLDNGAFSANSSKNGSMYSGRIDKNWANDRLYVSFNHMSATTGSPNVRPAFTSQSTNFTSEIQANYTHIFSPTTVNEASFAYFHPDGNSLYTGDFSVPTIYMGDEGAGYGVGWADGEYLQKTKTWREVLTHVSGTHTLKFGYDGWHGTDVALFANESDIATFYFSNILDLVQDRSYDESNLAYNGRTGAPAKYNYGYANTIAGVYAQDTWQAKPNLTVTYGLRWDNFGNAYPMSGTSLANFIPGTGSTFAERIANGANVSRNSVLNQSMWKIWSPRVGLSWDPSRRGTWVIRAGFGTYHDMPTLGNQENGVRGNPPAFAFPTFFGPASGGAYGTTAAPIFALGSSKTVPTFPFPAFQASGLTPQGGYVGQQVSIAGVDPNLTAPTNFNYSVTVEHQLPGNLVATIGYSGVHGHNLLANYGDVGNTTFSNNVNFLPGNLITNLGTPTGLNSSFGVINDEFNAARSTYNALIVDLRGRATHRLTFDVSYTRSASRDDTGIGTNGYPSVYNANGNVLISPYMGPSNWDAPSRVSGFLHYDIPGLPTSHGVISRFTNGWSLNATNSIQTGTPFTVVNYLPFDLTSYQQFAAGNGPYTGGDYNADGNNFDLPDVASYHYSTSRSAYLNGIFTPGQFTAPTTLPSEGNEKVNQFRSPSFWDTDASLLKDIQFRERFRLELRFEFLNVFNHVNLLNVQNSMTAGNFGAATGQAQPRHLQVGARFTF